MMLLENSIHHFETERNRKPSHVNEVLDYIQKCYIFGELSIVEYKKLLSELDKLNAEKPQSYFFSIVPFDIVDLPS
nr:YppF family protein [uncultured Bacillus sp.]